MWGSLRAASLVRDAEAVQPISLPAEVKQPWGNKSHLSGRALSQPVGRRMWELVALIERRRLGTAGDVDLVILLLTPAVI